MKPYINSRLSSYRYAAKAATTQVAGDRPTQPQQPSEAPPVASIIKRSADGPTVVTTQNTRRRIDYDEQINSRDTNQTANNATPSYAPANTMMDAHLPVSNEKATSQAYVTCFVPPMKFQKIAIFNAAVESLTCTSKL